MAIEWVALQEPVEIAWVERAVEIERSLDGERALDEERPLDGERALDGERNRGPLSRP